ncbi:MAG TPA: OmpA family protein [Candidatus Limnocylindria bacterium]|nr:OmpA family protein [Candidatus Limnocylindria bacterium]
MKKGYVLSLVLLVAVSGCGRKKQKGEQTKKKEVRTEIDIPVAADGNIKSFFDQDIEEFSLADDAKKGRDQSVNTNIDADGIQVSAQDDFAFMKDDGTGFKKIYFNFDQYAVRDDQQASLAFDIQAAKQQIEAAQAAGKPLPTLVVDGHACHSAGSRAYNLALSEKRAKVLADQMVAAGIPTECIKIVGRGAEIPALVNGKAVEGDREQQWANRRDEVHVVQS